MEKNALMVSICCQTYNHKDYIVEALESFLMQQTDFPFEILLRDDASTDGTAEICKEYAQNHPNIIKLLAYQENQFQKGISPFRDNVKRAKGKYIALCEGDDYWTDPLKLQKQVDFLEANEGYGLVGTRADIIVGDKKISTSEPLNKTITTDQIVKRGPMIHTCTFVFRNTTDFFNQPLQKKVKLGDWALVFIISLHAKIKCLNEVTAVYRSHEGGVYSPLNIKEKQKTNIEFQKILMEEYPALREIIKKDIHTKMRRHLLYDYSLKAFLKGETSIVEFLYKIRVKLNLGVKLRSLFKRKKQVNFYFNQKNKKI